MSSYKWTEPKHRSGFDMEICGEREENNICLLITFILILQHSEQARIDIEKEKEDWERIFLLS